MHSFIYRWSCLIGSIQSPCGSHTEAESQSQSPRHTNREITCTEKKGRPRRNRSVFQFDSACVSSCPSVRHTPTHHTSINHRPRPWPYSALSYELCHAVLCDTETVPDRQSRQHILHTPTKWTTTKLWEIFKLDRVRCARHARHISICDDLIELAQLSILRQG